MLASGLRDSVARPIVSNVFGGAAVTLTRFGLGDTMKNGASSHLLTAIYNAVYSEVRIAPVFRKRSVGPYSVRASIAGAGFEPATSGL